MVNARDQGRLVTIGASNHPPRLEAPRRVTSWGVTATDIEPDLTVSVLVSVVPVATDGH